MDESDIFYQVVAYVRPPSTTPQRPLMTLYARDEEDRDLIVARLERDNLQVTVTPLEFYRKKVSHA